MFITAHRGWQSLPRSLQIVLARLALVIPQMFGVLFVTFFLIRLLPGDPAVLLLSLIHI